MSMVSESNPWCDITSAENPLGMDSHPFTTASPFAQISFSLFARTAETPLGGPGHTQAHSRADYTRTGGGLGTRSVAGPLGRTAHGRCRNGYRQHGHEALSTFLKHSVGRFIACPDRKSGVSCHEPHAFQPGRRRASR